MNHIASRFLLVAFIATAVFARAAIRPIESERIPFTAKELQQGYTDRVILARPLAGLSATADAAESSEGIRVREIFPRFGDLRIIELDSAESADDAIARLRATGRYEFVEPDYLRHVAVAPNDPSFSNGDLWGLRNTGLANGIVGADIDAEGAWDQINEAPNVIVAVIDTGVNLTHEDIAPNLWRNPNPTFGDIHGARFLNNSISNNPTDDNGHGTHVAGTIGAVGNNGVAIAGVAWRVQIMAIKVFPETGNGAISDVVRGVNYAIEKGAHIINASYGALGTGGFSDAELAAITAAREAGILFVAASGNSAASLDVAPRYPASHPLDNIVAVGNSTRRDELALSTNFGSSVDLFAPGSEIVSLSHANNTGTVSLTGTSMSAPHVSGALALLKARFPEESHRQLINRLLRGVDRVDRFTGKAQTGGRLNVLKALNTTLNTPFNDRFADRAQLIGDNVSVRTSTQGATAEGGEPSHAGQTANTSLWYQWTPSVSGSVTLTTSGSGYDTVLAVYTAESATPTSPADLTPLASNDNSATEQVITSRLTFAATAGTIYHIAVSGKNDNGALTILKLGTTPANDAFAVPTVIAGESLRVTGYNANSSRESGEPRILGWQGGHSLWYRWTAPRSGRFQVSVESSDFDPISAVFTGSAFGALTYIAENDNAQFSSTHSGSLCTFDAIAGTTYSIVVDSKYPSTSGQFTLTVVDSLWQGATGDNVTGSPAIGSDGTVYVGSTDRSVYAFSSDGSIKWTSSTGGFIDTCSPAIASDGTVYIGSYDGKLYALTPSGATKWTHTFGITAPVSNSPALAADGTIYVKAGDGFLYALNPADGTTKWSRDVQGPTTYASPSVAPDGTIYQGSEDKKLYAFNPDGSPKWTFTADNDIYTAPAIDADGNLYFSVLNSGKLFCVSPAGVQRWTYSGASVGSSSSAALSADGSTVYFAGYDSKLHAVNTANGSARWTYPLGDEVRGSSPAIDANGVIYIGAYDFKLHAINPNGTLKRVYDTGDWIRSSPAIHGETLYVGSNDGKVYAFDIGAGVASGPWPQYRQNVRKLGRAIVFEPLAITVAPLSQTIAIGQTLSLGVSATGEGALTYEWRKDGQLIPGATSATYTVSNATAAASGAYTVTVRGTQGSVTSEPATILVELVIGRLTNVSVRTSAGSAAQTLTIGFVIAGGQPKPLLIRGVGPTLVEFGVQNPLQDPRLRLLQTGGATPIAENDNWQGAAPIRDAAISVGGFPLPETSTDSALLVELESGGYTAQITGANAATGIALAEVYDTEPVSAQTSSSARLVNLSARAQVGAGDGILIAGFAISGNEPKQILIRGIGPELARFGVEGALADPKLELHGKAGMLKANDDWAGNAELVTAFTRAGAFQIENLSSNDAALLVTLPPGVYTAQIRGVGDTTGVALIEVYEVP